MVVLGNTFSDDLLWDNHVKKVLIPSLKNRLRTLKSVSKYLRKGFRAQYCNAIFRAKLMFGIETWGGASSTLISQIQNFQNKVSKLALSDQYKLNNNQRQKLLHWFSINREIESAVFKHTYKILHWNQPEELASQMPPNVNGRRLAAQFKLACKPKWLGTNKMTRSTFRNRAYKYNTLPASLTSLTDFNKFKKALKTHMSRMY